MNIIKELSAIIETESDENYSDESKEQIKKCYNLYEQLFNILDEKQKDMLLNLDSEYFLLSGKLQNDGFKEGFEKGFKTSMKLLIDCLT